LSHKGEGCLVIKSISRWEFDQFLPSRFHLENVYGEQAAWWADKSGSIIGAVAGGGGERGWHCIMLGRKADGNYQVRNVQSGFESQQAASEQLIHAMETVE
jgi:hypothetical protein